ncbi:MAG TPA: ABC transporter permease [Paracoccaceae bacterium]|nr:ABC transporter permease [Paracoccaceae bacterium]
MIGAPGGQVDLAAIFARPSAVGLVPGAYLAELEADPRVRFAAPLAFGDSVGEAPVMGTTAAFVTHLADGRIAGRVFAATGEAVAATGLGLGDRFTPSHGLGPAADAAAHEGESIEVVGVMAPTGTPWDGVMAPTGTPWDGVAIVPVEQVWAVHGLATGKDPGAPGAGAIGPPFDPAFMPGLPAIVAEPESVAAAYSLRQQYRTERSQSFFPAEALVELYGYLGDVADLMSLFALATQALVILAILAGVAALMRLQRRQIGVLRALGAPRLYVGLATWTYLGLLVLAGTAAGLGLGWEAAQIVSAFISTETGMAISAALTLDELALAGGTLAVGALLALLPAITVYRIPIAEALAG